MPVVTNKYTQTQEFHDLGLSREEITNYYNVYEEVYIKIGIFITCIMIILWIILFKHCHDVDFECV